MVEWYTRWSKKPVPEGLRVRVSLDAPNLGSMAEWSIAPALKTGVS